MVPFWSPGVYFKTKEERSTGAWDAKAGKCRMLGCDERCKNAYMILTIPEMKIISRKDCIFQENLADYNISELMV